MGLNRHFQENCTVYIEQTSFGTDGIDRAVETISDVASFRARLNEVIIPQRQRVLKDEGSRVRGSMLSGSPDIDGRIAGLNLRIGQELRVEFDTGRIVRGEYFERRIPQDLLKTVIGVNEELWIRFDEND